MIIVFLYQCWIYRADQKRVNQQGGRVQLLKSWIVYCSYLHLAIHLQTLNTYYSGTPL